MTASRMPASLFAPTDLATAADPAHTAPASVIGAALDLPREYEAQAKRERALAKLEQKNRLELEDVRQEGRRGLLDAGNTAAMERLGLDIGSREKLAGEATTSRETLASEATSSREKIASQATTSRERIAAEANISREKIAGINDEKTDTSAAEKRFWDIAVQTAIRPEVDKDGKLTGREITDWNAVELDMEARNLPKLAATARRRAINDQTREDRKVALPIAEERVEAMDDSFFGKSDAEVYKQYGGSRAKALDAILREEMKKLADARSGYIGDVPPPEFPDAKRAPDGFWYVPDPDRPGKFLRVKNGGAVPGVAR